MLRNWKKLCRKARKTGNGGCLTSSGCPFSTDRNGVKKEYMTLLMRDQENVEKGEERGEERLATLILLLNEGNRSSDVIRVLQDKEYRQKLYVEYHLI